MGSPEEIPSLDVRRAALDGCVGAWLIRGEVWGLTVVLGAVPVVVGAGSVVGGATVVDGVDGTVVAGGTVVSGGVDVERPDVGHWMKSPCLFRQYSVVADAGAAHVPIPASITARSVIPRAHRILLCTIGWH